MSSTAGRRAQAWPRSWCLPTPSIGDVLWQRYWLGSAGSPFTAGTGATFQVTGTTAVNIDLARKFQDAPVPYLTTVVGLAVLLLLVVFRSILIPIKAALGFLLQAAGEGAGGTPVRFLATGPGGKAFMFRPTQLDGRGGRSNARVDSSVQVRGRTRTSLTGPAVIDILIIAPTRLP